MGMPNPFDKANEYFQQIPGILQESYQPYMQQGQSAYNQYSPILNQMTQDPAAYLSQLMSGYEESPYYSNMRDEALKAASATAAAGGRRGTPQDMAQQAKLSAALTGEGMQNWLQNVFNLQNQGLQGQQHLYDVGYGAAGQYGSDMSNYLGQQGTLAYQKQLADNEKKQARKNMLLKALTTIGGGALGSVFGPAGIAAGAALGSKFF